MNLIEGLLAANEKSRQHIVECKEIQASGHGGAGIELSIAITKTLIADTEAAIGSGDVVRMVQAAADHGLGADGGSTG